MGFFLSFFTWFLYNSNWYGGQNRTPFKARLLCIDRNDILSLIQRNHFVKYCRVANMIAYYFDKSMDNIDLLASAFCALKLPPFIPPMFFSIPYTPSLTEMYLICSPILFIICFGKIPINHSWFLFQSKRLSLYGEAEFRSCTLKVIHVFFVTRNEMHVFQWWFILKLTGLLLHLFDVIGQLIVLFL